jgi:hypothetical protein
MKLNILFLTAAALVNAVTADEVDTVNLGTAGDYVILAKTGISTVPQSVITGDIAVSPIAASAITGFTLELDSSSESFSVDKSEQLGTDSVAKASDYKGDTPSDLTTAVSNMEAAYTDAAGRPNDDAARINLGSGEIGGESLSPGVYTFGTDITITSDVTFVGTGTVTAPVATDIFIIQTTGDIKQASATAVHLTKGAKAENIFWQVAGKVEVGANAHMEGILLVKTAVTFVTESSLTGRVLTQTACNLQKATITQP